MQMTSRRTANGRRGGVAGHGSHFGRGQDDALRLSYM